MPGYSVWLRAWQVQVGRVKLYLLDSNDAANFPAHRGITSELYGGGPELRLKQELLLGIGGWRLLGALGIQPEVCHLNEGHAAFAVLERARSFMEETGQPFEVALAVTRAGNLFTTHTAVAAGFDRFAPALIEQYLGRYAQEKLGISLHDLLALGRQNPNDSSESFNMAYLAIRGSGAVNGVSRLHGKVSRQLFEPLFPRWPEDEVPGRTRDQRSPHADLGLGGGRRSLDGGLRQRTAGWGRRKPWSRTFAASPTPSSGNFAPPPASLSLNTPANDCPGSWPPPARRPRRSTRRSICSIPTH